ncbi:WD40 repeat-like protein [Daldinia sp. FL1419]|nr:WD40 repeat-like protein [Daldinia sp. FL1419]
MMINLGIYNGRMAENPSTTSFGRGTAIDRLTISDDEEDDISRRRPVSVSPEQHVRNSIREFTQRRDEHRESRHVTKFPSESNATNVTNATNVPTSTPTPIPTLTPTPTPIRIASDVLPTPSSQNVRQVNSYPADDRPSKRRKIVNGTVPKAASPATDTKALTKCLQAQVFPHVDAAVKDLDRNVFDVEGLGGQVIGTLADDDFQRHFQEGKGRLPPNIEARVVERTYQLVAEFTVGNAFRRKPITRATSQPAPASASAPAQAQAATPPKLPKPPLAQPVIKRPIPSVLPSIEKPTPEPALNAGTRDIRKEIYEDDISCDDEADLREIEEKLDDIEESSQEPHQTPSRENRESKEEGLPVKAKHRLFGLRDKPYLAAYHRNRTRYGLSLGCHIKLHSYDLREPTIYHVDFSKFEAGYIRYVARTLHNKERYKAHRSNTQDLRHLMKKFGDLKSRILDAHRRSYDKFDPPPSFLLNRSVESLENFLDDVYHKLENRVPLVLTLARDERNSRGAKAIKRANVVPLSLYAREMAGNRLGQLRVYHPYNTVLKSNREDFLEPKVEWTNCAGDIMTISWLPDGSRFVCGTTTHSDSHNQQYNKPGNLLFGDTVSNTLRAYPDHRIPRPLVTHGENSLGAMRESQDPWLFTSVVSSDYDHVLDFVFTSSFDGTVKVWHTSQGAIALRETWHHEGRVNFVVTNKDKSGSKVATAADVPERAVRVYHAERDESSNLLQAYKYREFSCKRVHGEDYVPSDKWAYFPSAIRWGIDASVNHLLLIGYSPRSLNNDDNEIPEDRRSTGELCIWDMNTCTEVKINCASNTNIFEVAWHPHRASFIAASSATQISEKFDDHIRTQIRIFELNEAGQYSVVKTLECPAIDINEIAIRPNSILYSYIAAGCTDGRAYVWDSAASEDSPMCVLRHGDPVEEVLGDREQEDVGVKFIGWATSPDRLYTGSSDGVVKVWNVRQGKGELIRNLIEVAAPVTAGAFSPDFTKLLIGDGSGRVYLMDMEDDEENIERGTSILAPGVLNLEVNGKQRAIRRPRPFIPHPEVPPPNYGGNEGYSDRAQSQYQLGQLRAKEYLESACITLHPDRTIGAVQGPAYPATGLFRADAHLNQDPQAPLLDPFERQQLVHRPRAQMNSFQRQARMEALEWCLHRCNAEVDAEVANMMTALMREALKREGVEFGEDEGGLELEDEDDDSDTEDEEGASELVSELST